MTPRQRFYAEAGKLGLLNVADTIARNGTTLQRLAEAGCNGDWPCDNGERKVIACPKCEGLVVPSDIKAGACGECRAQARIVRALEGTGFFARFQGDPRGCVVTLYRDGTPEADIQSGRERPVLYVE